MGKWIVGDMERWIETWMEKWIDEWITIKACGANPAIDWVSLSNRWWTAYRAYMPPRLLPTKLTLWRWGLIFFIASTSSAKLMPPCLMPCRLLVNSFDFEFNTVHPIRCSRLDRYDRSVWDPMIPWLNTTRWSSLEGEEEYWFCWSKLSLQLTSVAVEDTIGRAKAWQASRIQTVTSSRTNNIRGMFESFFCWPLQIICNGQQKITVPEKKLSTP